MSYTNTEGHSYWSIPDTNGTRHRVRVHFYRDSITHHKTGYYAAKPADWIGSDACWERTFQQTIKWLEGRGGSPISKAVEVPEVEAPASVEIGERMLPSVSHYLAGLVEGGQGHE